MIRSGPNCTYATIDLSWPVQICCFFKIKVTIFLGMSTCVVREMGPRAGYNKRNVSKIYNRNFVVLRNLINWPVTLKFCTTVWMPYFLQHCKIVRRLKWMLLANKLSKHWSLAFIWGVFSMLQRQSGVKHKLSDLSWYGSLHQLLLPQPGPVITPSNKYNTILHTRRF